MSEKRRILIEKLSCRKEKLLHDKIAAEFSEVLHIIKGSSGSGKTTLLKIMLGLEKPENGNIKFDELELNATNLPLIRKKTSWIPQNFNGFGHITLSNLLQELEIDNIDFADSISEFGFTAEPDKHLNDFSDGEKQRIFLAISKMQERPYLLADEPSSALDAKNKSKTIEYLENKAGVRICISHDEELLEAANIIWELNDGKLRQI